MTPEEYEAFKSHVKIEEHSQFQLLRKVVAHIDSQAVHISAMKEALIEERTLRLGEYGYLDEVGNRPFPEEHIARPLAEKSLRTELPEVSWDE